MTKKDTDLITIAEAQKVFSLGRMTIYRAINDGRLERYHGGLGDRRVYVSRSALQKLMAVSKEGRR